MEGIPQEEEVVTGSNIHSGESAHPKKKIGKRQPGKYRGHSPEDQVVIGGFSPSPKSTPVSAEQQPTVEATQETTTNEPEQVSAVASVPIMITKKMERELRARGIYDDKINKMTPKEAHAILSKKHEVKTKTEATIETAPEQEPAPTQEEATTEINPEAQATENLDTTTLEGADLPDVSETVPELDKVLAQPGIFSKKIKRRLHLESVLGRLRDKVEKRKEEKSTREKVKTEYEKSLKAKKVDHALKKIANEISVNLLTIKWNKKLSGRERAKLIKAEMAKLPKAEEGATDARKKQLAKIKEKLEKGKQKFDEDYYILPDKPKRGKIDLSPTSLAHKAVLFGAQRAIGAMDQRMEEIDERKYSPRTKEREKEVELATRAPFIKAIGKLEKKLGAKVDKKEQEARELEERRQARAKEFSPEAAKQKTENTVRTGEQVPVHHIESLDAKITNWLGEPLYEQFEMVKNKNLAVLLTPDKESAWKKFTGFFKKEESSAKPTKRQELLDKIKELFDSTKGDTEKFILSGMTLEQFLRRVLK